MSCCSEGWLLLLLVCVGSLCVGYGTRFFESEGGWGGRVVKEKQHGSANDIMKDTVVLSSVRDEHVLSSLGAHMYDSWINKGTQEGNEGQTPVSSNVDLIIISESHTSDPKYSGPSGTNVSHDTTLKAAATMPTNEVPSPKSFVGLVNNEAKIGEVNFRALDTGKPNNAKDEVHIPKPYVLEAHARFGFSLYGYFVCKRVAFPVIEYNVKNVWKKYGVVHVMMNANGFF
ncbi:hypothetical protein Tco_0693885 [Tanacetum coccineum]